MQYARLSRMSVGPDRWWRRTPPAVVRCGLASTAIRNASGCRNESDTEIVPKAGQPADDSTLLQTLAGLDNMSKYQLAVLAGGTCVLSLGFGTVVPILPTLASQWGDNGATGVGLVVAAPALAKLALNNYAGRWADTHGRVPLMVSGGAMSAAGNFLTALANSMHAVCGGRLVVGAGSAANGPASQAYLADVTAKFPRHRGAIIGTLGSIGMMSYGFGPALGGLLAEVGGPGICFVVVGAAAATTAAAEATLPETLPNRSDTKQQGHEQPRQTAFQLLQNNPALRGLLVMDCAVYIGWSIWLGVVPLHAVAVWGATPGTLGLMFSVMSIAGSVGAPLGGWLSDQIGRDKTIIAGGLCCIISTALLPLATTMFNFGAYLVIWDFGEGVLAASLSALAAESAPEKQRGQVYALRSQVDSAVFLIAPVAVGALADSTSLSTSLWLGTGVMAVALAARSAVARA